MSMSISDIFTTAANLATPPTKREKPKGAFQRPVDAVNWLSKTMSGKAPADPVIGMSGWPYEWEACKTIAWVHRLDQKVAGKTYRPVSLWPDGWWYLRDPKDKRWPLYRRPYIRDKKVWCWGEGEKVADLLAKLGFDSTTTSHGAGSAHLTDLGDAAGKTIYFFPDHDEASEKYIAECAAIVSTLFPPPKLYVVRLPGQEKGDDVVDWEARGGTREQLQELINAAEEYVPPPSEPKILEFPKKPGTPPNRKDAPPLYKENEGVLWGYAGGKDEGMVVLTNFIARVTQNIIRHEGVNTTMRFRIAVKHSNGHESEAIVTSDKYSSMNWVPGLGAEYAIEAGQGRKDAARHGIQAMSEHDGIPRIEEHTSLGWHKTGEHWLYLHAAGAIGADGPSNTIQTDMCPPLDQYRLPDPSNDAEIVKAAILAHLRIWEFADNDKPGGRAIAAITTTLVMRALIIACDFSVHLGGPSGNRKTSVVRLVIQHLSSILRGRSFPCPAGWRDTVNAIQRFTFDFRDTVLPIDDMKTPDQVASAEIVFQAQGNLQNRARMNVDQSLQRALSPRGAILSTGEVDPRTLSTLGRTLVNEIKKGDVDLEVLTQLQTLGDRGLFAQATASYIRWLAPQLDRIREELVTLSASIAKKIGDIPGAHPRHTDIVAQLVAGYTIFLRFAVEAGAICRDRADEYLDCAQYALVEIGKAQADHQEEAKPGRKFLDIIVGALASRRCYLSNLTNDFAPPTLAGACGWQKEYIYQGSDVGQILEWKSGVNSRRIGFIDVAEGFVYLDPTEAKQTACEVARRIRDEHQSFDSIGRELLNENLIEAAIENGKRRAAAQKRIPNQGKGRYYKIPIKHLFDDEDVPTVPTSDLPVSDSGDKAIPY